MVFRIAGFLAVLSLVSSISDKHAESAAPLPIVRIGIVSDGPSVHIDHPREVIQNEIIELTSGEFDIQFPEDKHVLGDWSLDKIRQGINRLFDDPEIDMILAVGPLASNEIALRKKLSKPAIAPIIIDAELQGLPLRDGASGVRNLVYLASFRNFERDIKAFKELSSFRKSIVLIDGAILEAFPVLHEKTSNAALQNQVELEVVSAFAKAEPTLSAIPKDANAVYVTPMVRMVQSEFQKLVEGFIDRKIPTFSMFGWEEVNQGILFTVSPKSDIPRLARRIALYVQRILLGEDAGTLPVTFPQGERLIINIGTARTIGFWPDWKILTEAELINQEISATDRRLTLAGVVHEAMLVNLDLAAADHRVAAGEQEIRKARSVLLPQLSVSSSGVLIDDDRAEASLGQQAERTWLGEGTASQLIYSEGAWANLSIQKHLQGTRLEERQTLRLDVVLEAATAYLNILKAKSVEEIQKDNLKLTRSNLELARIREAVGYTGPAEVFRWESSMANSRASVLEAVANRLQAEVALNRVLHQPMDEPFATEEAGLDDPSLFVSDPRFLTYIENPRNFRIFQEFMVQEGLKASPELRRFNEALAAKERSVRSVRSEFFLPDIILESSVTERFDEGGEGADSSTALAGAFPKKDDTDWTVFVTASIPLFTSGRRGADLRRETEELEQLRFERQATADRIEENIRAAVYRSISSFPSISLFQDAAHASKNNLDLIIDSYSRGVLSIIDLIDAQTSALVATQDAANAVYDFLIDLMNIQRASGSFDFFSDDDQRKAWFERADAFFASAGIEFPNSIH